MPLLDGQVVVSTSIGVAFSGRPDAHSLHMTLVAEGIETADQAAALRRLGCDLGQGYWFARPQPPEALLHLLRRGGVALPPSARIHSLGRPRFIGTDPVRR
jgi:predicted signal transduction protein with EAL and GGDEF domain